MYHYVTHENLTSTKYALLFEMKNEPTVMFLNVYRTILPLLLYIISTTPPPLPQQGKHQHNFTFNHEPPL